METSRTSVFFYHTHALKEIRVTHLKPQALVASGIKTTLKKVEVEADSCRQLNEVREYLNKIFVQYRQIILFYIYIFVEAN